MTYDEFEKKAGESLVKAYDEVIAEQAQKDPDFEIIGKELKEKLLMAIIPLNAESILNKLVFEELNISDEKINKALTDNYIAYKKNLNEQLSSMDSGL